jgi:(1->4)-alpha-D-glucan 1-alpha-D-glucosylmutase
VAFARRHAGDEIIAVAPRLPLRLAGGELRPPLGELWGDTWLALPHAEQGARYRDQLTGATLVVEALDGAPGLRVGAVLETFPVALLQRE